MKISAGDFGASLGMHCYFNGVELLYVTLADEDEGYVIQYVCDERGNFVVDEQYNLIKTRRRTGIVRLMWDLPEVEEEVRWHAKANLERKDNAA